MIKTFKAIQSFILNILSDYKNSWSKVTVYDCFQFKRLHKGSSIIVASSGCFLRAVNYKTSPLPERGLKFAKRRHLKRCH